MDRASCATLMMVCLFFAALPISSADAQVGVWWNRGWNYCLDFGVTLEDAKGETVTAFVDFARLMREAGIEDELDPNSPRVVRVDDFGNDQSIDVPALFEERIGANPGWGYLTWPKGKQSHHQIYFDTKKNGPKKPASHDIPAALAKAAVNLLPNPGFEIDKDGNGLPDGWSFGGQDFNTGKWYRDRKAMSLVYDLAAKPVHSGGKSLKWHLGRAVDKWKDCSAGCNIREDIFPSARGRKLHFRGHVYLESGSGIVPVTVRQSNKEGWIGNIYCKPLQEATGRWVEIKSAGALTQRTSYINLHMSMRPSDAHALYYFDDFNLQIEYPAVVDVALDKKEYFLSDATAFVTARFHLGTQVLMPMSATLRMREAEEKLVTIHLKTELTEDHIRGRKLRLVVEQDGKALLTQEADVQEDMKVPLNIAKLKEGAYTLRAAVADDVGQEMFTTAIPFSRIQGPFDF